MGGPKRRQKIKTAWGEQKVTIEHLNLLAACGGYICASSRNIIQDISLENFWTMRVAEHA